MWFATLNDGSVIHEGQGKWSDVKARTSRLGILVGDRVAYLPASQPEYMQGKSASAPLYGGEARIESRWIACRTASGTVVRIRIDERTGEASVEIEQCQEPSK